MPCEDSHDRRPFDACAHLAAGAVAAGLACGGEEAGRRGRRGRREDHHHARPATPAPTRRPSSPSCAPSRSAASSTSWCGKGYTDTLFAKPFEDACGVKVNATYMGSSDELVAKLRAGGAETIDLVSPSSDAVTADHRGRPGPAARSQADPELRRPHGELPRPAHGAQGHAVYGLPWAFGPNPLIYDTTKVTPAPDSWNELWDTKYRGKLSLQDDIATLWMVAQTLGMDDPNDRSKLYNLCDEDLAKVKAKALELRPQVRKYWATAGDMTQLFQSGEIVAGEGWPLMTASCAQARLPGRRGDSRRKAPPPGPTTGC